MRPEFSVNGLVALAEVRLGSLVGKSGLRQR
jgi:hypothetical protein